MKALARLDDCVPVYSVRCIAIACLAWQLVTTAAATAPPDLSSAFDADAQGWRTSTNNASLSWQNTGGASAGYLRGSGANSPWYFVSPESWAGDWSQYRVLKFELAIVNRQYADAARNNIVIIRGSNGVELAWSGLSPEFTWTHYEVQLLPGAFQVDSATFDSVIQAVAEVRFLGEYTTGSEQVGLDSVLVTAQGPPTGVNELMSTFSTGIDGWRPVDDVTLSQSSTEFDGNTGGKLLGDDWADGRVYWFASPVDWAGNWSAFKTLMFDLTISGGGSGADDGTNLRIYGANGRVLEAALGIPTSGTWRHYTVELAPPTFGVDQAYFDSVMAHVIEMRLRGEYINGNEEELLDNVIVTRELRFPLIAHDLVSNFQTNTENWRVVGNGSLQWQDANGNPGGFLRGIDGGAGIWYFVSPESWAGDWTLLKQLRFQLKFLGGAYGGGTVDTVRLRTYNGLDLAWSGSLQASSWTPYTLDLTPTNFGVDRATFDSAIRNVKEIWIRGESTSAGNDSSGLDRLVVSLSDAPIVPPDHQTTFDAGTEGWRPSGSVSMTWQSSEGNPGGFLRGRENGSDRWGFASPELWCGDWRQYRLVSFDHRIVAGSDIFAPPAFQILGANGQLIEASFSLQPASVWTHYDIPLSATNFGVSQSAFRAVMRNVVEMLVMAEVIYGDDAEAIDNVILTKASSPYLIWRDQYWSGADRENEGIAGVYADPDGDTADNWSEFVAGTYPTNRLDYFKLDRITSSDQVCVLEFMTHAGRTYTVESIATLQATPWTAVTNLLGTGDQLSVSLPPTGAGLFYRLQVTQNE